MIKTLLIIVIFLQSCAISGGKMENKEVIFTNDIPICPYCNKPTKRSSGVCYKTALYYSPIYDENGNNTNPDRNIITREYQCLECGKTYVIKGNDYDGWRYLD